MIFISPSSEAFFRSGLAKSAFKNSIYENLPLDVYLPSMNFIANYFSSNRFLRRIRPKFYQIHDSYLMFLKPSEKVLLSLKKQNKASPTWTALINQFTRTSEYLRINELTKNSDELSILASIRFLENLLRRIDTASLDKMLQQSQSQVQIPQEVIQQIQEIINGISGNVVKEVEEFKELKETSEEAINVISGSGGKGFTKEALSVLSFLEKPEEFRKRVKLLSTAVRFFRHFIDILPATLSHLQQISFVGGINGVTRMIHERQLSDILPSELVLTQLGDVGKALFALKVAQKQINVYQRAASVKPIVFVDKSGSMADTFMYNRDVPKISIASGLALAMYLRFGADVYFFDTEIEKVDRAKIVDVLLRISADGGTNIDPVLREILAINKPDYLYIIISDGITEASESVLSEFAKSRVLKNTKLVLVDYYSAPSFNWVELLKKLNNVYLVNDVASLDEAVKKILS